MSPELTIKDLQKHDLFVSIDLETTGLDPQLHDIWEIAILPFDENYKILPCTFKTRIQPMNPMTIQEEALQIGNITRKELMEIPVNLYQVLHSFYEWKLEMYPEYRFIPCGHNYIDFDKQFLKAKMNSFNYHQNFSHKSLDTKVFATWLSHLGYNICKSTSLGSLKKHFNIEEEAHTAEGDAKAVIKLLKKFDQLIKGGLN